jgi:uncharacterized protein (TIGR00725 family)
MQIAVIGSGDALPGSEVWDLAEEVGRRLAKAEATVVCGGRGGVMEAVAKGAAEAGGEAIAVLPWTDTSEANPYCSRAVATGIGRARNLAVVASGAAAIAVGGGWGTLSEIGYARGLGRPVVTLRSWELNGPGDFAGAPGIVPAETPAEAVATALDAAAPGRAAS